MAHTTKKKVFLPPYTIDIFTIIKGVFIIIIQHRYILFNTQRHAGIVRYNNLLITCMLKIFFVFLKINPTAINNK